jgi:preprotein translocase subunit SecG
MMNIPTVVMGAHVLISIMIIGLVLIQRGKGAEAGAAFGAGASGTVFGAKGSANFLSRSTGILAALFFATSLSLAYLGGQRPVSESLVEDLAPAGGAEIINILPTEEGEATGIEDLPGLPALEGASDADVTDGEVGAGAAESDEAGASE